MLQAEVPADRHDDDTLVDDPHLSEPTPSEPEQGTLFADRYRIERRIGRGSMGTVYAAHDRVVDERVALKLLLTPSARALERFRREVRLARRVTHRNAARTFDLGEYGGAHFISMELVEGESLQRRIDREPPLTIDEIVQIAVQICQGLQAAHEVDVVHRDLKPANVLVDDAGRVVITDFGVAWSARDAADQTDDSVPMAGTPAYMAPEQVMGVAPDGRADLYALGVMLFEMLTGQSPFTGGNRIEVAMARLHRPPPDPRSLAPAVPPGLAAVVLACLHTDPDGRPSSPTEVIRRLQALGTEAEVPDDARGASASSDSSFVTTTPGDRALAVMPFRYRGPSGDEYLADALTDELIDLLAMTRGLRVSARGATAGHEQERDARAVGRALGVDAIIEGTIHHSPPTVRIVARLIDVQTGFQRYSERFEGRLEDVFELQDRMAKRVAESLRVELTLQRHGAMGSAEAVEQYLRGRALAGPVEPTGDPLRRALEHFDRARALAPGFVPALAARADAAVRLYFISRGPEAEALASVARTAVTEALAGAPELAETHLAAARLAVNEGDFRAAAHHLDKALEIAPTYAAAHEYLGMLQCDAGRSREGAQHITLAHELDPSLGIGMFALLRHLALRGDNETRESLLARLRANPNVPAFGLDLFELRFALWNDDHERARTIATVEPSHRGNPILQVLSAAAAGMDRSRSDDEIEALFEGAAAQVGSPRLRTAWRQLAVEVLAWRGATEAALRQLRAADAEAVLLDADWLESCPLLGPLQSRPELAEIRSRVRDRADAIWRVGRRSRG